MKRIFAVVVSAPILALFVGIGTLAFRIADTWDQRNTDVLITNITMVCGVGGLLMALLLSSIIGLILYARWQRDQQWSGSVRRLPQPTAQQATPWMETPPRLTTEAAPKGKLYSAGPGSYEDLDMALFDDGPVIETEWSERT